jgi:hypothetical protein
VLSSAPSYQRERSAISEGELKSDDEAAELKNPNPYPNNDIYVV